MRRSTINQLIRDAIEFLAAHNFLLPRWAFWSQQDWAAQPAVAAWMKKHQMGWDVTDFGCGNFDERGLVLFCMRNGSGVGSVPYAEKVLILNDGQEVPLHKHWVKKEDIINRGGANLRIELFNSDKDNEKRDTQVDYRIDGIAQTASAGEPIVLEPGDSIRLETGMYHRFYGAGGRVLIGEVSMVNDDMGDNYFYNKEVGRFSEIEEDEPASYSLWNEL